MTTYESLSSHLALLNQTLRIPTLSQEVGEFLSFFIKLHRPKSMLEFGSGIGSSVLWSLPNDFQPSWEQFILTERRLDCIEAFKEIPWPATVKQRLVLIEGEWSLDKVVTAMRGRPVDFVLVDGQKNQYQQVVHELYPFLSGGAVVMMDNTNWEQPQRPKSATVIKSLMDMHECWKVDERFQYLFLPKIGDGVSLLLKRS